MISHHPGGVLCGHDIELVAMQEGCALLPVNASVSGEAVALDRLWSGNALLLLYVPFNLVL